MENVGNKRRTILDTKLGTYMRLQVQVITAECCSRFTDKHFHTDSGFFCRFAQILLFISNKTDGDCNDSFDNVGEVLYEF